jgi:hypothetical protein
MNYATHDLELAMIVHTLKMWRNYLMGKKFELRTDHFGLKHLFGQPTLNARQTRWLEFLSEYDFEIKHIKGKENQVFDALSRRDHEVHIANIIMYETYLKDKIIATTNSYQNYLKIKETLQQGSFQHKFNYYELKEDGIIMYEGKVHVPNSEELKKCSVEGDAQCAIRWEPRISKNNCSSKKLIFLARNEERSG